MTCGATKKVLKNLTKRKKRVTSTYACSNNCMLISQNKFVSISVVLHFYHILYSFSRLVFIQIHIGNAKIAHKFVPNSCHRSEIVAVVIIVPRIAIQLLNVMLVVWANIAPVSLMHDIRHSLFQTVPTLCISLNISIFAMFIHF